MPAIAGYLFLCSLYQLIMQLYRIWCRRTNDSDALWSDMPYAPRYLDECERLVDYYEDHFKDQYQYEIVPVRSYPSGMREPCFV